MKNSPRISRRKGGKAENKIAKVMHEFKEGKLKSSSGEKVTDRQQAIAIGLSEARTIDPKYQMSKKWSGGEMAGGGNINGFFSNDGKTFINVAVGKSSPNRKGEVIKIEERGGIKWATVKFRDFQEDIRFEDNSMKDRATVSPRKTRRMARGSGVLTNQFVFSRGHVLDDWASDIGGSNMSKDNVVEYDGKTYLIVTDTEDGNVFHPNKKASEYEYEQKRGGSMAGGGIIYSKEWHAWFKLKDGVLQSKTNYTDQNISDYKDVEWENVNKKNSPLMSLSDISSIKNDIRRILSSGGSAMEEAGQVPENLVEKLKDKYRAQIQDMGITEIFIDPFGEVHITSEHDIDPSWAEAIEADARALSGSSGENAPSNGSQNVATLISFADGNSKLSDEKAGIMNMSDEMKWNSERLHQQFKRIFSYMAETSYNKENPESKIELTEAERHEFADALASHQSSTINHQSSVNEPDVKNALQNLNDANAKLDEAESHTDSAEDTIGEAKQNVDRAVDDLEGNKLPFKNGGGIPDNKRPEGFKRVSPAEKNQATYKGQIYNYNRGDGNWYPVFEGNIPNNYSGKTPKEVWNEWRPDQRKLFILDHSDVIYPIAGSPLADELANKNYDSLPSEFKEVLRQHISEGQYKNAGKIPNNYIGKFPEQIWSEWNSRQRLHFIIDHTGKQHTPTSQEEISKKSFNFVPIDVKKELERHSAWGQYAGGGKATDLAIGTIYKLKNGAIYTVISHRTVIDTSLSYESDAKGNPIKGRRIISSNSWLGETPEVIGKIELDSVSKNIGGHTYTYYLSGDKTVDTEMSHFDARWKAFAEHAGKKLRAKYDEQEEHNNHYANAKMVNDWFNDHKYNGGSTKPETSNLKPETKIRMTPQKKKQQETIKKLERALAGHKMSAKAEAKLEKQLQEYKADFDRRVPVYERMMESKGKFYIEIPAEYRLKMNTLLHGTDLKPRLNELEGKLRITVDNKPKLNRLYKIYSDMLTKKKKPVPSLEEISGSPKKVKAQR